MPNCPRSVISLNSLGYIWLLCYQKNIWLLDIVQKRKRCPCLHGSDIKKDLKAEALFSFSSLPKQKISLAQFVIYGDLDLRAK